MSRAAAPGASPSPVASVLEVTLFAAAFLLVCIVTLALLWSGDAPYRDLAQDNGAARYTFVVQSTSGGQLSTDLDGAVAVHQRWSQYVTGGADEAPRFDPPLFTEDEYSHMADVRRVFDVVKFLVPAGLFVLVVRLQRARARGPHEMWRLVRVGALAALGVVVVLAVATVFAFDALFLLFHRVFFPQGNFLFDPDTSNLIRVWPVWYWEGMFLRVGLSFLAAGLAVAAAATLRLRAAK